MTLRTLLLSASLFFTAVSLQAKPAISFDTREFDCGSVMEGKTDKLEAVFNVRNTGDEPLKLISVKPSCGCTVVKYDSIIQPGASTAITSTVNIKGRKGALSKAVTITSNAESDSIVRVLIKANIVEVLTSSLNFIDMTGENQTKGVTLQLTTQKKDLKIGDITFTPDAHDEKGKNGAAVSKVTFTLQAVDTTRTDEFLTYRLEMQPLALEKTVEGQFTLKTNQPERKEMTIRGKVGK